MPLAIIGTLPFRIPLESAGETANLLVPLYVVIAAGVLVVIFLLLPAEVRRPRWVANPLAIFVVLYALQALYSEDFSKACRKSASSSSPSPSPTSSDAGVAPPTGGGFEVRRRDGGFGMGVSQDLVLRSPVRGFSIPREAQIEQYYVRMYDGATPPVYSRFSSAVFTDIPVG